MALLAIVSSESFGKPLKRVSKNRAGAKVCLRPIRPYIKFCRNVTKSLGICKVRTGKTLIILVCVYVCVWYSCTRFKKVLKSLLPADFLS